MTAITPATTIDEVISALDRIIDDSIHSHNRLGYFAALYRRVTVTVKQGIVSGTFEDGPRMEKFDVAFANRYLSAFEQYHHHQSPTKAWALSFDVARDRNLMLLQHLLLGMNAHINLDLGIVAAEIAPGTEISSLERDFDQINIILGSLVGEVVDEFSKIWPFIGWADRQLRGHERAAIGFEMEVVRNRAWKFALDLAVLDPVPQTEAIAKTDQQVAALGHFIAHPGFPIELIFWIFRKTDFKSTSETIRILNERLKAKPVNMAVLKRRSPV
jgi:hypothetical protein